MYLLDLWKVAIVPQFTNLDPDKVEKENPELVEQEESFHSLNSSISEIHRFHLEDRQEAEARAQGFTHALILETEGVSGDFRGFVETEETDR